MPLSKLREDAFSPMRNLTEWFHKSAKMTKGTNLLKCEDDDLHDKISPLLEALGYDQIQEYGYMIYRISGKTEVIKRSHLKTLFFPLDGEVQAGDEVLMPGTFAQIDSTLTLDSKLDCLFIYLPE
ncbi:hypothetical protein F1880_007864 [Penicillium rolfsii]|nr:hypothetical protein F1880_007864 [Penicillium rolfsii]